MKRTLRVVFLFATAFILFSGSRAYALVDLEGRYWFTDMDASLRISEGSVIGTDIDVVDDLGVDDKKNFWEGRITLELGNHKIRYGFTSFSWDGKKTITKSIVFAGKTYTASTSVESSLDIVYHRVGYEYDFIDTLDNRIGVILEVKYFDIDSALKASALGYDESESLGVPLPAVGVTVQVGLPFLLTVGGEITGITVGSQGYLVDGEAGVNFKPIPLLTITGGYRYLTLHVENEDDEGDFTLSGPYIMLRADF